MGRIATSKNLYIFQLAQKKTCNNCKMPLHEEPHFKSYKYIGLRKHSVAGFCRNCFGDELKITVNHFKARTGLDVVYVWKCEKPPWMKERHYIDGEQAFIDALLEKKIDPNLRLVYADFLEQNGVMEEAEYQRRVHSWQKTGGRG